MKYATRGDLTTDGQFRKYLKIAGLFEKYITLHKKDYVFNGLGTPFIDGSNIGFESDGCRILFVGATSQFTKDGGTKVWVDTSASAIKKHVVVMQVVDIDKVAK